MTNDNKSWVDTYLSELETAGNRALAGQLYEDKDGNPSSVAGMGSIGLAAFTLATELAATSDNPPELSAIVAKHKWHVDHTLGPDAWPDVLFGVTLHLTVLYLEPAYKITDASDFDMRSAARTWWGMLKGASEDADRDA
ncbi:hypothetical protein KK092_04040 [Curtobacterium flaccumfaciens pv. flaccumfaciens]|uniref:hypothetical protein n=1 Tax=Curtobacterium flaccumfaciens TaxID=2035 RepID=UPI001BDF1542|nr:hypothetical protein [Curtobacterium flaccumfaciens]MBT1668543.1 hypothetical protein [Curtobacterium flaccumfaciens pv. flaccumfaciens]